MSHYDFITVGNYTKDTIVSAAGTRYVDGGGYNYAAHAAKLALCRGEAVFVFRHLGRQAGQLFF